MFRFFLLPLALALSLAAPASAQERQWVLDAAGEDVFLAFGVPNTDDVGISFWCKIGQKSIRLFTPINGSVRRPKVTLSVGTTHFHLKTKLNNNEGAKSIEALLQPQTTILEALENAQRFEVTLGKHKTTYPLADADFQGLVTSCAGKAAPTEN
jgi:hypothetical protein